MECILQMKKQVESRGLKVLETEGIDIHDAIKVGTPDREQYITSYITALERLGQARIHMVYYNSIPASDRARSDLAKERPGGSTVLTYSQKEIDKINPENMFQTMGEKSNGFELPGWGPGRMVHTKELLDIYKDADEGHPFNNLVYFLKAIQPVCEKYGIKMVIHLDDPARPVFGLARVITGRGKLLELMRTADTNFNGIILCTGSLGSNPGNNIPDIVRSLKGRISFAYVRNLQYNAPGDFQEVTHLSEDDSMDMYEIMKTLYNIGFNGIVRPDHGRAVWGEVSMPGYDLYDRALGACYPDGLWEAIRKQDRQAYIAGKGGCDGINL